MRALPLGLGLLAAPVAAQEVSEWGPAAFGCDGITVTGSAKVDSWDSTLGLYSGALARNHTSLRTGSPGADIVASGFARIHGDLLAARDLRISNGELYEGALIAGRDIRFQSNPPCPVDGVVAGNNITTPGNWWVNNCGGGAGWQQGGGNPLPDQECDPLDVSSLLATMISEHRPAGSLPQWPYGGWRPNRVVITQNSAWQSFTVASGAHPLEIDAAQVDYVFIDGDFRVTSGGQLHVTNAAGMNNVQELLIIVDGDFRTDGGSTLAVDPGISVRVYVTGTVLIGGGAAQDVVPSIEIGGIVEPTFGIYTSYSGGVGVSVTSSSPLTAVVYAPLTDVTVNQSGVVYGAVRGRTVSLAGSGWIHYDENLALGSNWDGTAPPVPLFALTLAVDQDEIAYNEQRTFQLSLSSGPADLPADIALALSIPPTLEYVAHDAPAGTDFVDTDDDGVPDTWQLSGVQAGTAPVLEIVVQGTHVPDSTLVPVGAQLAFWASGNGDYPDDDEDALEVCLLPSPWLGLTMAASAGIVAPGESIQYTTTLTNLAQANALDVYVRGDVHPELAFSLDAFGPGAPFRFVDGPTPSGLVLGTPEFSANGGATWTYVPVSGGGGAPSGFDASVTSWRILMVGAMNPKSSFQVEYQALLPGLRPH